MNNKAQIQMMETIAILFIFFVLVFFGLVFYLNIMKSNTEKKMSEFKELSDIEVAQIASSLPELQCSEDNILKTNCIDIYKMEALIDLIADGDINQNDYFGIFAFSKISVEQVFPIIDPKPSWTIYDREPDPIKSKKSIFFPISLYHAVDQNYYFGVLKVEVYT